MSLPFPAWFDLINDKEMATHPQAQRVYSHLLQTFPRIFFEPTDVKAWLIAKEMEMSRDTVNESLDLLTRLRYLVDHGRGLNNVRRVTIAVIRCPLPSSSAAKSA